MESTAKAYGKILVFGAYSILEPGNIGLVVNIDKGTTTKVEETKEARLILDLSTFNINVYGVVEGNKVKLSEQHPALGFIKNAVECTYMYLNEKNIKIRDVRILSYNDPELYLGKKLKSGFGSSATATVSTVAALLNLHEIVDVDLVYKISLFAHMKTQEFKGSGFDVSASCYGSHFFMSEEMKHRKLMDYINSETSRLREKFEWPSNFLPVLVFSGKSASTSRFIKKIEEYKYKNPLEYNEFIHNYNQVNLALKQAFEEKWPKRMKYFMEKSWSMRKQLGNLSGADIETEKHTKLIREMMKHGAFTAGLVGAGGGDSILALCMNRTDKEELELFLEKKKLHVFKDIKITNMPYESIN